MDMAVEIETERQLSDLDELAYAVSHDVRAVARALIEIPTWIAEDLDAAEIETPEEVATHLELLTRSALRMDLMLKGLLEFSRVGRYGAPTAISLSRLISDAWAEVPLPPGKQLRVDGDVIGTVRLPPPDPHLLLSIPLENAVLHGGTDICLTTNVTENRVEFSVSDDGDGVPEDCLIKIFRPLWSPKRQAALSGSGMGLATLRKIVGCADGTMTVDQSDGRFTLTITLPLADPDEASPTTS